MENPKILLLSIKPQFARSIFSGEKLYEFRKTKIREDARIVLLYASSPKQALVGFAEIEKILEGKPEDIWQKTKNKSGIEFSFFEEYYKGKEKAFALKLKNVCEFNAPIEPHAMFKDFVPPQSYAYLEMQKISDAIDSVA